MKKQFIFLIVIVLVIVIIISVNILQKRKEEMTLQSFNAEYEQYLNKEIYGIDIATLINKAIDNNKKNNVEKDEKGFYIDNEQDSILIDIVMITNEEKQETTTYKMETIEKVGILAFLSNFNLTTFKGSNVEYHEQTGKISKITFEQLESISY